MKRILKIALCIFASAALALSLLVSAGAIKASECGLKVTRKKDYSSNGKLFMSFTIQTGTNPRARYHQKVKISAGLYDSGGKRVVGWNDEELSENITVNRNYGYNYNDNLAAGTYTFNLHVAQCGTTWDTSYSSIYRPVDIHFTWRYTINHAPTAILNLQSTGLVTMDDGSYQNKIIFSHKGAKDKRISMEIYDEWNNLVASKQGNAHRYIEGTYTFYWDGFPSNGGAQCESGTYKIKYWLSDGSAKQSSVWLDFN
jgi:hypothetical protein